MADADKKLIIDFNPTPGHLLIKPLKREEVAALYNRGKSSNLSLPDNVGKVSDSVGIGRVIKLGWVDIDLTVKLSKINVAESIVSVADRKEAVKNYTLADLAVGDYVAHMPYTDLIIEIDGVKYSLLPYDKVWAVRKDGK